MVPSLDQQGEQEKRPKVVVIIVTRVVVLQTLSKVVHVLRCH